jgi:hypothetical protein
LTTARAREAAPLDTISFPPGCAAPSATSAAAGILQVIITGGVHDMSDIVSRNAKRRIEAVRRTAREFENRFASTAALDARACVPRKIGVERFCLPSVLAQRARLRGRSSFSYRPRGCVEMFRSTEIASLSSIGGALSAPSGFSQAASAAKRQARRRADAHRWLFTQPGAARL